MVQGLVVFIPTVITQNFVEEKLVVVARAHFVRHPVHAHHEGRTNFAVHVVEH